LLMAHYTKNWQVAGFFPQYSANFSWHKIMDKLRKLTILNPGSLIKYNFSIKKRYILNYRILTLCLIYLKMFMSITCVVYCNRPGSVVRISD
jgi:hypothetical protein